MPKAPKDAPERKPIPARASEAEERAFWERHDSTEYLDWAKAKVTRFTNLKPTDQAPEQ